MTTPERFTRRGCGRALLGAALDHAHSRVCSTALLEATPVEYPLYEATGWRTFETWDTYTNAESDQFH